MKVTSRTITVRWTVDGYHRWPDAPHHRGYLASRHRHRFGFAVTIPVGHDDRAVEFHDLLDDLHGLDGHGHDFGALSCEAVALDVAGYVLEAGLADWVEVAVDEDGYVTGTIRAERDRG